ncbi:MAG: glycerate kinase [Lachnospira sp.]|nr:glycerate kinase [Lachnospira sp.]
MNVVVAIDSLKGSLTSLEAGKAISEGIKKVMPDAQIEVRPLADGGEGTVEALALGMHGRLENVTVTGPLGEQVSAAYGILDETSMQEAEDRIIAGTQVQDRTGMEKGRSMCEGGGRTAIIEMSAAAGITLVTEEERNPMYTTTYGVGEMIKDAIQKGCRHFIVGIGGSATNDGGIGMLQALGYGILDKDGKQVSYGAQGLNEIEKITDEYVIPELKECTFRVACDVTNTLCGEQGCSAIFGPQKGATPTMIMQMDKWLAYFAALSREKYPQANMNQAGTGAAGGLGFAFLTYTNAVLESGIKIVLEETRLEEYVKDADIVVTGEGRLDGQTAFGKAPIGVAEIAKKYGKKVIAFSGCVTEDAAVCNEHGIDAFFPILRGVVTLEEAMNAENARENMIATVEQVFRLIDAYNQR